MSGLRWAVNPCMRATVLGAVVLQLACEGASPIRVSGTLVGENGLPVSIGTVTVTRLDGRVVATIPALGGRFTDTLVLESVPALVFLIDAPGFSDERIIVSRARKLYDGGQIKLVAEPGVRLGKVYELQQSPTDSIGSLSLVAFLTNTAPTPIVVESLLVDVLGGPGVWCAPTPGAERMLNFDLRAVEVFRGESLIAPTTVSSDLLGDTDERVGTQSRLRLLHCAFELSFYLGWPWSIAPDEEQRLRVDLRRVITIVASAERTIRLDRGARVFLSVVTSSGQRAVTVWVPDD